MEALYIYTMKGGETTQHSLLVAFHDIYVQWHYGYREKTQCPTVSQVSTSHMTVPSDAGGGGV